MVAWSKEQNPLYLQQPISNSGFNGSFRKRKLLVAQLRIFNRGLTSRVRLLNTIKSIRDLS